MDPVSVVGVWALSLVGTMMGSFIRSQRVEGAAMTRTDFPDVINFGWRSRANRDHYRTTALGVTAGQAFARAGDGECYFLSRNLTLAKETS